MRFQMYSPNSLTQSVSYRVIRYNTTDKTIAAEVTGTVTTDIPIQDASGGSSTFILCPHLRFGSDQHLL